MINVLDQSITNRISAGEVVEKPSSVVKELLDNSIDAGADAIVVEIKNGGIDYISVQDNGCGIAYEDMKKAFLPHATSKIKSFEDIENILTLGFRGEALASISSVSQTTMSSKTKSSDYANEISINGGEFGSIIQTAGNNGTKIEVSNLFFNTPARKKFLKKSKYEENDITSLISQYILANPSLKLKYIADDKTIYNYVGGELRDAISCVYGNEYTQHLLAISYSDGTFELSGYVCDIEFTKPNTTYQTLMVNGRYVIEPIVSKAVYSAFEEFLMSRQFPVYIMNLRLDPNLVDVNVHPSKTNVKFANPSALYDFVYKAIKSALFNYFKSKNQYASNDLAEQHFVSDEIITVQPTEPQQKLQGKSFNEMLSEIEIEKAPVTELISTLTFNQSTPQQNIFAPDIPKENAENTTFLSNEFIQQSNFKDHKVIGIAFNEFLVLEKDENLMLIDFHAGHERLNYDKFCQQMEDNSLITQDLLSPYIHTLNVSEIEQMDNLMPILSEMGFKIEHFGNHDIKISSVPLPFKDINLKTFVENMLHDLRNFKPDIAKNLKYQIAQRACKASVKAGQKLSDIEIDELIKKLDNKKPVLLCPHGRPVIYNISKTQIERWFKRTL